MPIKFVSGDLFNNLYGVEAYAHGCNCQGSMGAGIAKDFRERYPQMYEQYRLMCKAEPRQFNLGDAWLWKENDKPAVFNLGTQERYWRAMASYPAIEQAFISMKEIADKEGIRSIAIPRIGVGFGGLDWDKVRIIVEQVFANWSGKLIVYEEYTPMG
jgi:O-acetyl-ADP-ribose deacetylase (regulator of RNase III)